MWNLFKFYTKRILFSPFYWVSFSGILICFLCFKGLLFISSIHFINYVAELECYTYFELLLLAIPFCIAVYYLRESISLEISCLFSKSQIYVCKCISIIFTTLLFNAIPIVFIIIAAISEGTDLLFTASALIYFIMRWSMLIITAQSIASFFTCISPSPIVYILCVPTTILFSHLNQSLFFVLGIKSDLIVSFFSMQKLFVNAMDIDYSGARVDLFLTCKELYVVVGASIVLAVLYLFFSSQKRKGIFLLGCLIILQTCIISLWAYLYPRVYTSDEKIYCTDYPEQISRISSYSGKVTLDEICSVNCDIEVNSLGQDRVVFRLDECFKLDFVKHEGKNLDHFREGDYITVFVPVINEPFILTFKYSGRVYYLSDIYSVNIFSTRYCSALPARFAFIPIIDGEYSSKKYIFEVTAHNTLISNLAVKQLNSTSYSVSGEAVTCSLFSGYFDSYEENGITFYRARYNQITDYASVYKKSLEYRIFDPFKSELADRTYPKPDKVFLIYGMYGAAGFPIVYDDYVLLNYGYVFS